MPHSLNKEAEKTISTYLEDKEPKSESLLHKVKFPVSKKLKKKLDDYLNENINIPLAKQGKEDIGAAISAAVSTTGELFLPEDLADAATMLSPGLKALRTGTKGMKALVKTNKKKTRYIPKPDKTERTLDYAKIKKQEKQKNEEALAKQPMLTRPYK